MNRRERSGTRNGAGLQDSQRGSVAVHVREDLHGVRGVDVWDAPDFADIAADVANLLQDRVFVAHNADFDLRFLCAEFERFGTPLEPNIPALCTMRLGSQFGLGGSSSLADSCMVYGIDNAQAHCAGDDAAATAHLLTAYQRASIAAPGWREYWGAWEEAARAYRFPPLSATGVPWQRRKPLDYRAPGVLELFPWGPAVAVDSAAENEYGSLLDRYMLDGTLSVSESQDLVKRGEELGITRDVAERLHTEFIRRRVRSLMTWRGASEPVLAENDERVIQSAAEALGLSRDIVRDVTGEVRCHRRERSVVAEVPDHGQQTQQFTLKKGDMVALTGELEKPRSEWEQFIVAHGVEVHDSVTKKVKLLVAADPDSMSTKAEKARKYQIPIVDSGTLERLLSRA